MFEKLTNFVSIQATNAKFTVKKHSPEILMGLGIAGMVTSTVLACRATLKAKPVIEEKKRRIKELDAISDHDKEVFGITDEDIANDKTAYTMQAGLKVIGLYLPAVTVGVLGITCLIGGNKIHNKREASLAASYAALDQMFKKYRAHAIEKYGADADKELRFDTKTVEIKDENGEKKNITVIDSPLPDDDYSMFFDEGSPFWEKNFSYNQTRLLNTQALWNRTIRDRARYNFYGIGFVTLVEIYVDLGITMSPAQMKRWKDIGWCIDINDPEYNQKTNYIDFGLGDVIYTPKRAGSINCADITPGYDPVFLIQPNVQGNIYTMMS